jgi:mRNA interferase RelE/StbE
VTLRVEYDEEAIDQAAGFLRDDPGGVREVLDLIDELAGEPRPAVRVTGPATFAGWPLPRSV